MKPRNKTYTFTASPHSLSNVCIPQDMLPVLGLNTLTYMYILRKNMLEFYIYYNVKIFIYNINCIQVFT